MNELSLNEILWNLAKPSINSFRKYDIDQAEQAIRDLFARQSKILSVKHLDEQKIWDIIDKLCEKHFDDKQGEPTWREIAQAIYKEFGGKE